MKQRIRRIWLALCMAVCLFALAGCSAAVDTAETIDPQIEMAMQSGSQQYLDLFNQMDDASIEQALATSVKNKDTVMENALNPGIPLRMTLARSFPARQQSLQKVMTAMSQE